MSDIKESFIEKFRSLREESLDEESKSITDSNDRRKYISLRNMEANRLAKAKGTKSPISQDHHRKMAQQHNDDANAIMDKYRK
jgi:hypothetical protein